MSPTLVILKREFASYFQTPIAIIFLTVFLVLNGVFTFQLGNFYQLGQADLGAFFVWHPWLYLFIVPAVSMRLWAEEQKSGTIELLLTHPVTLLQAMVGKFLAAWIFLTLALFLTFPIVLTVCYLGDPDVGVILAGYIGSVLLSGTFLAIGCCISTMTNNQIVSFVTTTATCFLLILLGFVPVVATLKGIFPARLVEVLSNISFPVHFEAIHRVVLELNDLVYFGTVIFLGLIIGALILERKKAE